MTKRAPKEGQEEGPLTEAEIEDWDSVEEKQPLSAVLTVRFTPEEIRRLRDLAKESSSSMADVVRRAVGTYLADTKTSIFLMGHTAVSGQANVLARSGIRTFGVGQDIEEEDLSMLSGTG